MFHSKSVIHAPTALAAMLHRSHAPVALHSTAPTRIRVTLALRTRTRPFAQFPCLELRAKVLAGEPTAADPPP